MIESCDYFPPHRNPLEYAILKTEGIIHQDEQETTLLRVLKIIYDISVTKIHWLCFDLFSFFEAPTLPHKSYLQTLQTSVALSPQWHIATCSFHSLGRKLSKLSSGQSSFWCRLNNSAILTLHPHRDSISAVCFTVKALLLQQNGWSFALHLHWWFVRSVFKGVCVRVLFPRQVNYPVFSPSLHSHCNHTLSSCTLLCVEIYNIWEPVNKHNALHFPWSHPIYS